MNRKNIAIPEVFNNTWSWRSLFFISILLRTYFSLSLSYIHPDEHFQGPEALADHVFGWATKKSWEFSSDAPARSYFAVWLVYGIPMALIELIFGAKEQIAPVTVLYALRMWFAVGSWVLIDMAIDRLCDTKQERIKGLFFASTSYVTWTFQSHTFSNSVETVILLWCLVIIHEFEHMKTTIISKHVDTMTLGALVVIGTFNRITFPAFLILPAFHLTNHFIKHPLTLATLAISALVTTLTAIYVDTSCYGQQNYVITPLNNLLYNISTSNLQLHGLHSRFHHVFVNLPELLGPVVLVIAPHKYWRTIHFQSALSGILMFSLIRHQEARFLVPAVPLLICSIDLSPYSRKVIKCFFVIWLAFNLIMGVLMGVYHQGGVIPAQVHISSQLSHQNITSNHQDIYIWWKTYSPPIWLLGRPQGSVQLVDPATDSVDSLVRYAPIYEFLDQFNRGLEHNSRIETKEVIVVDLMGAPTAIVKDTLLALTPKEALPPSNYHTYLIAPISCVEYTRNVTDSLGIEFILNKVWESHSHLSLDIIDLSDFNSLKPGLGIWQVIDRVENSAS